jgi:ketosteroid isomerase-like protein
MQREDMLAKVEAAYEARRTGDFAKLEAVVAEDAAFSFAGEQSLLAAVPGSGGVGVHRAARELFDTIEMRELERLQAVAEDNRVAILWKTTLVPPGGKPFETLMFDLWEFDGSGRICRGTQFLDTAKIVEEMRPRAEAMGGRPGANSVIS